MDDLREMTAFRNHTFSIGEKAGIISFCAAFTVACMDICLSAVPLSLFVLLCLTAPFLPGFSFFLPIITRGKTGKKAVALTFDDGPDPLSTPELLALLSRHNAKATFFVCGKNAEAYPGLIRKILSQGHSLGNHTYSHDNLLMLKGFPRLEAEIGKTQQVLKRFGIRTFAFRPPVGITNPRLRNVLEKNSLYNVNFSCRGPDAGNRWIKGLAKRILRKIRPDDILLLHDTRPQPEENLQDWLNEMNRILHGLHRKGFSVLPLAELIGKEVMDLAVRAGRNDV